jgi:thioredoxin-related protein
MNKTATYFVLLFLVSISSFAQNWQTNFEQVKAQALNENKSIVLVFSGSDWCAPCIKLDKTVWQSEAFKNEAEKNWIIYKADFPKKKANQLAVEMTEQNKKLAEKYNKNSSFPLVVILDKNAKVLGMTGFKNVSAEEYIKIIQSFIK